MREPAAACAAYTLRQEFRYDYPGPIHELHHRLIVAPPERYGDQRRVSHRLVVTPPLAVRWNDDAFGNLVATIEAPVLHDAIGLAYEAVVERSDPRAPDLDERALLDPRYRQPSGLTVPGAELRAAAAELAEPGAPPLELAERIGRYVFDRMRYVPDATTVATTAAQAFHLGTGVCQDYAHVMIALCRLTGIPARYVSGHLLGEGGTHAWVEVLHRDADGTARAHGFDPTHARRTSVNYVFVAAGRDYADVPPTSGCFVAPYAGQFTARRSLTPIGAGAGTAHP